MRLTSWVKALTALVPVAAAAVLLGAPPAAAASLQEVTNFGANPSGLRMFVYVPDTVAAHPAIVVAVHYCHGDGPAFFNGSDFGRLADQYGFIVIFPSVTQASDGCFDVATSATLTHNGGSDSLGIVSMVNYVEQHNNGDASRVYATGVSSGAMMTNVLLGAYPDVFKAGSAFAGVPFGCFAVNPDALRWSTACATGTVTHTPQEWGDLARAAYPGYSGARPRMQLWHGTADTTLNYVNFGEEIKQWTNVLGVSQTPTSTDTPQAGWTRTRYANGSGTVLVEATSMQGVGHNLPVQAAAAIHFFGLDAAGPSPSPSATRSAGPSPGPSPSASTLPSPTGTTGPRTCTAGYALTSTWPGGFVANVTVTAGGAPIGGWTVTLALPAGASVANSWNGQFSAGSGTVRVTNMSYNGALGAGQATAFGFQGSGTGSGATVSCTAA
jgi:acetylxylan esterase